MTLPLNLAALCAERMDRIGSTATDPIPEAPTIGLASAGRALIDPRSARSGLYTAFARSPDPTIPALVSERNPRGTERVAAILRRLAELRVEARVAECGAKPGSGRVRQPRGGPCAWRGCPRGIVPEGSRYVDACNDSCKRRADGWTSRRAAITDAQRCRACRRRKAKPGAERCEGCYGQDRRYAAQKRRRSP